MRIGKPDNSLLDAEVTTFEKLAEEIQRLRKIFKEEAQEDDLITHQHIQIPTEKIRDIWPNVSVDEQLQLSEVDGGLPTLTTDEESPDESLLLKMACDFTASESPFVIHLEALSLQSIPSSLVENQTFEKQAVGLHLPGNSLASLCLPASGEGNNLRALSLSANPLQGFSSLDLSGCRFLLSLDLSYCEELDLSAEGLGIVGATLRRLLLDGCGLRDLVGGQTAAEPLFARLPRLRELSLQENELEDLNAVAGLSVFQDPVFSLTSLNLKENEVCTSTSAKHYKESILKLAPKLTMLDNLALQIAGMVALGDLKNLKSDVEKNDTVVGENLEAEYNAAMKGNKDNTVIA
mmetsp:Transcript_7052/g.11711  ORF Transcript_7052/g.11711 Transcript_7052/m.11711 type:complete len:349 (+) Transcript_7052:94-1140(+)